MEQNKGLGGSLVEVFDAGLNLVKTEARVQVARATDIVKAKGIGVVLLLASTAPLVLGLIFLILFVFYGLMRLGLGAWAAALFIAIASFGLFGLLVAMGLGKLTGPVKHDQDDDYDLHQPYAMQVEDVRYGAVKDVRGEYIDRDDTSLRQTQVSDLRYDAHNIHTQTHSARTHLAQGNSVWASTYAEGDERRQTAYSGLDPELAEASTTQSKLRDAQAHYGEQGTLTIGKSSDKPGISVSTEPTYKEDMKKEGY